MFKVNTALNYLQYAMLVEKIADGYFEENGDYQPHYGILNAMRLFYVTCVAESPYDAEEGSPRVEIVSDLETFLPIMDDREFVQQYFHAIDDAYDHEFNFGLAYHDAMSVVRYRMSSVKNAIEYSKNNVLALLEQFTEALSENNLEKITGLTTRLEQSLHGETDRGKKKVQHKRKVISKVSESDNIADKASEEG